MAIKKEFKGGKAMVPGEHVVTVTEVEIGKSKAGDPMLTVHLEADDGAKMKSFYVKTLKFHVKQLEKLKEACGLAINAGAEELQGKHCGISVELGKPNAEGRQFPQIVGYGKPEEVDPATVDTFNHSTDDIKF